MEQAVRFRFLSAHIPLQIGSVRMDKRLIKRLIFLLPEIQAFFESEEGQREYAEWKAKREAEQQKKA